ncbi:MAG: hypothetical protein AMS24_00610 [Chlamydiae bacterium SM23_39]|nr:MAG: hypothetical protein AMS24_00610 [Chlamydiae bacterium SM23_39]
MLSKIKNCSEEEFEKNLKIFEKRFLSDFSKKFFFLKNIKKKQIVKNNFQIKDYEKINFLEDEIDTLIIYGIEAGYFYFFLKKFIEDKKIKKIIFLEEDFFLLERFLKKNIAKIILKNKKIEICFITDLKEDLKNIIWNNVLSKNKIVSFYKSKIKKNRFFEIKKIFEHLSLGIELLGYNYKDFGKKHFKNFFFNLSKIKKFRTIVDLKDAFKDIPAIICGAGPSLEKDMFHINNLKDKAIIFAGGTAIDILLKNNGFFHFAANIDKNISFNNSIFDSFFLYQNQLSYQNLNSINGEKILALNSSEYPLEKEICRRLKIDDGKIDIGWTVGTFLIKIAEFFGCNPIILTGLDFSFKKNKYAKIDKEDKEKIFLKDKNIFSRKDWILAVSWIEDFIFNNKKIFFCNTVDSGMIKNILSIPLLEVEKRFLKEKKDIISIIHQKLQSKEEINIKEIEKVIDDLEYDIEICIDSFNRLSFKNLENNIFYKLHLQPIWNIFKYFFKNKIDMKNKTIYRINKIVFFKNVSKEFLKEVKIWRNML